jgi:gliding motility-associated protein GldM
MALPKEPRQKMINIMYLVLTALLALNVSAEILNAFKTVNNSLETSSTSLDVANNLLLKQLNDKLATATTHDKAAVWQPIASQAEVLCSKVYNDIEDDKQTLLKNSGFDPATKGDSSYNLGELEAPTRLFIEMEPGQTESKGMQLHDELAKLKADLLAIDTSGTIGREFADKLPIDVTPPKTQSGNTHDAWDYSYFHMTPTVAAITILSKFQNDVTNSENQIVTYCNNKINDVAVTFDKFAVLTSQSSNYVMPGQPLTITTGIGGYSSAAAPTISIGGSTVPTVDGSGTKTFNVTGSGDQSVTVNISYKDQDGHQQSKQEVIKYTVGTPGGAAASADKMNVFYIGVPNPVTVGSPTGWDKTHASLSTGSLTGSAGKFVATETGGAGQTTNLIVVADGKSYSFPFRIKRIPDPIFKVGPSSGGAVQAAVFKAQQYCRAELENFDFDARFQVISATVYFTGAGFSVVQVANIDGNNLGALPQLPMCRPGSSVIFDNVKVKGPDGTERTIPGPGFLLK